MFVIYTDIASSFTAGQVLYYPKFQAAVHGQKLGADIMDALLREQGFEAVLRIRCSKGQEILLSVYADVLSGLRVENYYGHYFRRSSDLLTLANVDSAKSFGIEIKLDDSIINSNVLYLQTALLYPHCIEICLNVYT